MPGAVILAGGRGTRLGPTLGGRPKAMAPIGRAPFLAYLVGSLVRQAFSPVAISVGFRGQEIEAFFDTDEWREAGVRIVWDERLSGTGPAAIAAAKRLGGDDVLVCNGDTLVEANLRSAVRLRRRRAASAVVVLSRRRGVSNEGAFHVGADDLVLRSDEAATRPAHRPNAVWRGSSTGTIVFSTDAVVAAGGAGRASLERDVLPRLIDAGGVVAFDNGERDLLDIGSPERLRELRADPQRAVAALGPPTPRATGRAAARA